MAAVEKIDVTNGNLQMWGVVASDYIYDGNRVDFQDLMIRISEKRATTVEAEIQPLSKRMRQRNANLDKLGQATAEMGEFLGKVSKETGDEPLSATVSNKGYQGLILAGVNVNEAENDKHPEPKDEGSTQSWTIKHSVVDKWNQQLKTKMDALNNASQQNMTRLQSLVDRRDESYSTATSLMQSIADTRASLIRNLS